jgi:thiol-disulfide isomerase/thioredoxin
MKHLFLALFIISIGVLTYAQSGYISTTVDGQKILKGVVTRDVLEKEFPWFKSNEEGFTPNTETVSILKAKGARVNFLLLGGTWCEDTQALLPKYYLLMDAAGIGSYQFTFVAVDKQKHALDHLPEDMHLKNTPTLIVLKDGKEAGRIVEYGPTRQWETDLGEIIKNNF